MDAVDPACRTVTIDGKVLRPSRRVFKLCETLSRRPGQVFTRAYLMDDLGISLSSYEQTVDCIVKEARKFGVTAIKTSWGTGYYWEDTGPKKAGSPSEPAP